MDILATDVELPIDLVSDTNGKHFQNKGGMKQFGKDVKRGLTKLFGHEA